MEEHLGFNYHGADIPVDIHYIINPQSGVGHYYLYVSSILLGTTKDLNLARQMGLEYCRDVPYMPREGFRKAKSYPFRPGLDDPKYWAPEEVQHWENYYKNYKYGGYPPLEEPKPLQG